MSFRQIAAAIASRFVPAIFVVVVATIVIEPLLRRRNVLATLQAVHIPLVIGEPLLMAGGAGMVLFALGGRLDPPVVRSSGRHVAAAFLATATMFVTSIYSQGARLPFIIGASIASGMVGALLAFGSAARPAAGWRGVRG